MQVKKIRGSDMREALFRVRSELGSDAVIIHTRTSRPFGLLGLWRRPYVEITASHDARSGVDAPAGTAVEEASPAVPQVRRAIESYDRAVRVKRDPATATLSEDIAWIKNRLGEIARKEESSGSGDLPEPLAGLYRYLCGQEMAQDLAHGILERMRGLPGLPREREDLLAQLRGLLEKIVMDCRPIALREGECTRCALIGPTGVGKTTTIAKLAADFSLIQKKKVSVITVDTYRIAAVEQIRTYMDIIGIPLEVVTTPDEMSAAVRKHADADIVLIDTAGRSQRNKPQLDELARFLDAAAPHETHLVLSSAANYAATMDIIEKFSAAKADKLLFTKLDEAVNFGLIFSVASRTGRSLSYLTNGQSVPDDIQPADFRRLALMLMERYR